jgi:hypothetical protein
MESRDIFYIFSITKSSCQQEEMHSSYANLSNVAHNIPSLIQHGIGVVASLSLGGDIVGWRYSKTTVEILQAEVVVRQSVQANHGRLAGN